MRREKTRQVIQVTSLLLLPLTLGILSPVTAIRAASEGVINAGVLFYLALFLSALFLGRLWCGWLCPLGALQDITPEIKEKEIKQKYGKTKYAIWIIVTAAIVGAAATAENLRIDPTYETATYAAYYAIVGIFYITPLFFGKRAACHYLCWMAPFMALGRKIRDKLGYRALELKTEPRRCGHCALCNKACPMSITVHDLIQTGKIEHPECILCGKCTDVCPALVIKYGI